MSAASNPNQIDALQHLDEADDQNDAPCEPGVQDLRSFSILVEVTDPKLLYERAVASLTRAGVEPEEASAAFRLKDGRVNVNACLVQLLDPNYSPAGLLIMDSSAQRAETGQA